MAVLKNSIQYSIQFLKLFFILQRFFLTKSNEVRSISQQNDRKFRTTIKIQYFIFYF